MVDHRDEYEFCLAVDAPTVAPQPVESIDFDDELTPVPTGDDDEATEPDAIGTCRTSCGAIPAFPGNAFCLDCEADIGAPV